MRGIESPWGCLSLLGYERSLRLRDSTVSSSKPRAARKCRASLKTPIISDDVITIEIVVLTLVNPAKGCAVETKFKDVSGWRF